jgi:hypothetical protein
MRALIIAILVLAPVSATAGPLADAIAVEEGSFYFNFETREGVRGNGKNMTINLESDGEWHSYHDGHRGRMTEGPGRVWLRVRDGEVVDVELEVGGPEPRHRSSTTTLGSIDPVEVRSVMLALAENSRGRDLDAAIVCAIITEGFEDWDRLLAIARDEDLTDDVRESAIFWLGQEASTVSTAGLEAIVDDDDVELELREHAIFSLSQQGIDRCFPALSKVALESRHPQLREQAFFWLAQHDDPRVLDLLERVLLD